MRTTTICLALAAAMACVGPPKPTATFLALQRNRRGVIEGIVRDENGLPVSGLRVQAVARREDVPWSQPARTDSQGRFQILLLAPAEYGFALRMGETTVVTSDPRDPARLRVAVGPGEHRRGIELLFLRRQWSEILGKRPAEPTN